MGAHSRVREKRVKLGAVTLAVCITEIGEHLPDLSAAKEMLLGRDKKFRERLVFRDKSAGKAVVKETLVAESVTLAVERKDPF
jgi:hypothetical protein